MIKNYLKLGNLLFLAILFIGFVFRLTGISTNHSFWSDEAHLAVTARDIVQNKISIPQAIAIQDYQPLHLLVITASFLLFGISEFTTRLPYVLFGTAGIVAAFLLAKKLSTISGGLLASMIYAISQINLANSTQAKPYTALQAIILFILFLLIKLQESNNNNRVWLHLTIILLASFATVMHFLGVVVWVPYLVFLFPKIKNRFILKPAGWLIFSIILIVFLFIFQLPSMLRLFIKSPGNVIFSYNHLTYLRELFWKQYGFFTLPALFGILMMMEKRKTLTLGVLIYLATMAYFWNFKQYTHNIRYVLPLFGLFFVYFGVFWSEIGDRIFDKKSHLICLLVAILLYAGGNKIVRKPAFYYTPNADFIADIQIANYKQLFNELQKKFPDMKSYVIYNDFFEPQGWYLDGRLHDALLIKHNTIPIEQGGQTTHHETGIPVYTSLGQFKTLIKKNPQGVLIIEDWESFLPLEIKNYGKIHLKKEITVNSLPQAIDDPWPLTVYSWGM